MRDKNYVCKSIIQMVLKEGYTDRGVIAEELGISRKYVSRIINRFELELKDKILEKLDN